jgi:hypothetical protein
MKETRKHSKIPGLFFISVEIEFYATVRLWYRLYSYWHKYWFSVTPTLIYPEESSEVSVQGRKLELRFREMSGVQDNFRAATGALHHCNVTEHRHDESASEGAY